MAYFLKVLTYFFEMTTFLKILPLYNNNYCLKTMRLPLVSQNIKLFVQIISQNFHIQKCFVISIFAVMKMKAELYSNANLSPFAEMCHFNDKYVT